MRPTTGQFADFDGDGQPGLHRRVEDWADQGWDNAFTWPWGGGRGGRLHGFVYLIRNHGSNDRPEYEPPARLKAGGVPIDTFGMPSPNLADFDFDGDLDLICGEFLDRFTYFENVGTRTDPSYAAGRRLLDEAGAPVAMHLQMIVPVAIDWDGDGDVDLVVGDEDGRVALVEHTGKVAADSPRFRPPAYFQQRGTDLKFGALVTPTAADWDDDGDTDLICGCSSGELGWFENLGGGVPPRLLPLQPAAGSRREVDLEDPRPGRTGRSRARAKPSGGTRSRAPPTGTATATSTWWSTRSGARSSGSATWARARAPNWKRPGRWR